MTWRQIRRLFVALIASTSAIGTASIVVAADSQNAICKAAIAEIMGRDPQIIKIDGSAQGITKLSYVRPDDGSKWAYRCKVDGNQVIWAADPGRWREHPMDEKIFFESDDTSVTIIQQFNDGSALRDSFPRSSLGD